MVKTDVFSRKGWEILWKGVSRKGNVGFLELVDPSYISFSGLKSYLKWG